MNGWSLSRGAYLATNPREKCRVHIKMCRAVGDRLTLARWILDTWHSIRLVVLLVTSLVKLFKGGPSCSRPRLRERVKTRRTLSGPRWTNYVNLTCQVSWQTYCVPCGPHVTLLPPSYCLPRTSCDSASLGPLVTVPPSDLLWLCLPQTSCGSKIRIHSRSTGTQEVQHPLCYLTHQVHTIIWLGPFSDPIHPSWFLPFMETALVSCELSEGDTMQSRATSARPPSKGEVSILSSYFQLNNLILVWLMGPIFFATPCKHPHIMVLG